jgi:hypothetical protein
MSQATTARSLIPLDKAEHPEMAMDVLAALHPIAPAVAYQGRLVAVSGPSLATPPNVFG